MIIHIISKDIPQTISLSVAVLTVVSTILLIPVSGKIVDQKFKKACG
jgi:hypothetical protein